MHVQSRYLCCVLTCLLALAAIRSFAADASGDDGIVIKKDIPYLKPGPADEYARKQCLLDVYLPGNADKPFPLVVWFHGGALKGGAKNSGTSVKVAKSLAKRGVGVILAEYRMSPKVKFPTYITDAAQAVRWASDNAVSLKAQPKIYVGGHSAGGYLAAILAMDEHYLKDAGVGMDKIAGFISMSGQMMTHFTIAAERGISEKVITADDAAPIHYLRKETPLLLVLIGDKDWPARLEENQYFVAASRRIDDDANISFRLVRDRDHGGILKHAADDGDPAAAAILDFMNTGKLPPDSPVAAAPVAAAEAPAAQNQ